MTKEIWKPIKGYEGLYEVSNLGRVKNVERVVKFGCGKRTVKPVIKKTHISGSGYESVGLSKKGKSKSHMIHRLVASHFLDNKDKSKIYVNHIDGNKLNNKASNLEWCTPSENAIHSLNNNLSSNKNQKQKFVYAYSLEGEFLFEMESISKMANKIGVRRSQVYNAIDRPHKSSAGYMFTSVKKNSIQPHPKHSKKFYDWPFYILVKNLCEGRNNVIEGGVLKIATKTSFVEVIINNNGLEIVGDFDLDYTDNSLYIK